MNDELEAMIDLNGLDAVLESLACICHEKAEHISSNYQDRSLATAWTDLGKQVSTVSVRAARMLP